MYLYSLATQFYIEKAYKTLYAKCQEQNLEKFTYTWNLRKRKMGICRQIRDWQWAMNNSSRVKGCKMGQMWKRHTSFSESSGLLMPSRFWENKGFCFVLSATAVVTFIIWLLWWLCYIQVSMLIDASETMSGRAAERKGNRTGGCREVGEMKRRCIFCSPLSSCWIPELGSLSLIALINPET